MSKKVFIPMSIDQNSTTRTGYFTSPLKSFIIVGSIIPGIPFSFYAYSASGDSYIGMFIAIFLYLLIYANVLRFFVFEERKLKKMLKKLEENKISTSEYFWGISKIEPEGLIHYRYNTGGIKKAVIVKVTRGSMVGIPASFEDRFKECNLNFVRSLLDQGFTYQKYTKMEKKQIPQGLSHYSKLLEKMPDNEIKSLVRLNIDTISKFTKDFKSVVTDYYVIETEDLRLFKSFRSVIRDITNHCYGNDIYFKGTGILNDDQVASFLSEVLNISYINKKGYYNLEDYSFDFFGDIYRVFDRNGNEVLYELENSLDNQNKGKNYGKSLEDLEEEELQKKLEAEEKEENEVIYLTDEDSIEDYDEEEYEIVYVDEEGNEILDHDTYKKESRNVLKTKDEIPNSELEDVNLFDLEDKD